MTSTPLNFSYHTNVSAPSTRVSSGTPTGWKVGDEVELPKHLGGSRARVVYAGTTVYMAPPAELARGGKLYDERMVGVEISVPRDGATPPRWRFALVPASDLVAPACATCGKQ